MATFIRLVIGETLEEARAYAQADLDRGHSFAGYAGYPTEEAARESDEVEFYDVDPDSIAQHADGSWGFALEGLCGFAVDLTEDGYPTIADALADGITQNYETRGGYQFVALYEGSYLGQADGADGDLFRPAALLSVEALS
jgi:hypothetical protein